MRQRNRDDDTGVSEMKAFGEELLATGTRYIEAGKRWLTERRDDMTSRNDQETGQRRSAPRGADPYASDPGDDSHDRSAWSGSRHTRTADDARPYGRERDEWDRGVAHDDGDPEIGRQRARRNEQRWHPHDGHRHGGFDAHRAGAGTSRAPWDEVTHQGDDRGHAYGRGGGSAAFGGRSDRLTDWGHRDHAGAHDDDAPFRGAQATGSGRAYAAHGSGGRAGGWRGVGPKGYTRSDARITEDVCERLMDDDGVDVREVSVQVRDGVVTLEGHVHQRWIKHRIEDIAENCSGVRDVENRIRVQDRAQHAGGHAGESPGGQRDPAAGDSTQTQTATGSSSQPGGRTGSAGSALGGASATSESATGASSQTSLRSEDTPR